MALPTRPTVDAEWASGAADILEPSAPKKGIGWVIEKPPLQFFNWLFNTLYKWQIYMDRRYSLQEARTAAGAYAPGSDRCRTIYFDAALGNQSLTLPAITVADDGLEFTAKKIDATLNTVTITGTVEGEVNPAIEYQYTGRTVIAYGGVWYWKA